MPARWKTVIILILLASASAWLLNKLTTGESIITTGYRHDPDYYMENFTTRSMGTDGNPKNILTADYMAHYPDSDTTELTNPRLEVFRENKRPVNIIADKGWVTENNEVILLTGYVRLREEDDEGAVKMEIISSDVKILADQDYAETEKPVKLTRGKIIVNSTGMRAWMKESRFEFLDNVHTIILPETPR